MKHLFSGVAIGIALTTTPAISENIPVPEARVEAFAHTPSSRTAPLISYINWQLNGICNFARVEIEQVVYNSTAKHCMEAIDTIYTDAVLIENITALYKRNWFSEITYTAPSWLPRTVPLSKYTPNTIVWKELTIESCFPDKEVMYCYKIIWTPYMIGDMAFLFISVADQARILSKDSKGRRTRIQGMSGGPAFGPDWGIFGNISMNNNRWDRFQRRYGSSFIAIQSIRDANWKILPRLVRK
jgi:hypothetical protein